MPISANHLTTANASSADPHTTASISPTANALILAFVRVGSDSVTISGLSGNGLTWVLVDTQLEVGGNRISVYRAMGASPSAGAVTIDLSASAICAWSIVEFTGVDTSGTNGSGAVVNSETNVNTSATSLTVTLPTFADVNNATVGGFYYASSTSRTLAVGSGFTQLGNVTNSGIGGIISEWKSTNDTSVDASHNGTATYMMGAAVEIKPAVVSATGAWFGAFP